MILFSPRFDAKCICWKEWLQGKVLEARAVLDGARIVIAAIYQHVWSAAQTLQANKDDRAQGAFGPRKGSQAGLRHCWRLQHISQTASRTDRTCPHTG